jgi:nucleoid-associated protein YgaU
MKTILKSLLYLLPVVFLHSAEAAVQKEGNPYTVKEGDTLFDIAQAYYGDGAKWQQIANDPANKSKIGGDSNNPIIHVGDQLNIPNAQ